MAKRTSAAAKAIQPTPVEEAAPPLPAAEQPKAEPPQRALLADPFPVKTVNLDGYKVQLQHSRQANEMQIRFGDGTEKDKPSDEIRDFVKSHKVKAATKEGEKEVQLFHWNKDDRAWGMRIDREMPATSRQKAEQAFEDVVKLVAQERGVGQQR